MTLLCMDQDLAATPANQTSKISSVGQVPGASMRSGSTWTRKRKYNNDILQVLGHVFAVQVVNTPVRARGTLQLRGLYGNGRTCLDPYVLFTPFYHLHSGDVLYTAFPTAQTPGPKKPLTKPHSGTKSTYTFCATNIFNQVARSGTRRWNLAPSGGSQTQPKL